MEGGKYTTWFSDDGKRELRAILYRLENLGIVKPERNKEKLSWYTYKWILTEKGENIITKDKHLQKLKEEGDTPKFLKALKEVSDKKEFFIP